MEKGQLFSNRSNIDVAINEIITKFSINRNLKKLLQNDIELNDIYIQVLGQMDIIGYMDDKSYEYGSYVWFLDSKNKLWLLKCIYENNKTSPGEAIADLDDYGNPNFEKYGWEDQNKYVDIMKLGLESRINRIIEETVDDHQNNELYHKFGKLVNDQNSDDFIDKKVLKNDFSNLDPKREYYFFPSKTGHIQNDTITNGTYRVWDNGLLEFDIVFRVGYVKTDENGYQILTCNNKRFQGSLSRSKYSSRYNDNAKYFQTFDDYGIFMNPDGMEISESKNDTFICKNRNKYVNTFFAELNLFENPIEFGNNSITSFYSVDDYMVFSSGYMCQDGDFNQKAVIPGQNQLTWGNKTIRSITAILVTYKDKNDCYPDIPDYENLLVDFGRNAGLVSNTFSCHIIGRWK